MNDDVHVVLLNLPTDMRGFLVANADGSNTVVLNARYSWEQNCLTYLHELKHIDCNDFYADASANDIEADRHEQDGQEVLHHGNKETGNKEADASN